MAKAKEEIISLASDDMNVPKPRLSKLVIKNISFIVSQDEYMMSRESRLD